MSADFTAGVVSRCPVVETAAEHCDSGYRSGSRRRRLQRPSPWADAEGNRVLDAKINGSQALISDPLLAIERRGQ